MLDQDFLDQFSANDDQVMMNFLHRGLWNGQKIWWLAAAYSIVLQRLNGQCAIMIWFLHIVSNSKGQYVQIKLVISWNT